MAITLTQRHLHHFKRTLHLETIPTARALLRCSCIHGAEKSRGLDGTAWKTTDGLGKLGRAPTRKLEHPPDVKHSLYRQKDRLHRVPTKSCTHRLNSARCTLLTKGSHGSRGINMLPAASQRSSPSGRYNRRSSACRSLSYP